MFSTQTSHVVGINRCYNRLIHPHLRGSTQYCLIHCRYFTSAVKQLYLWRKERLKSKEQGEGILKIYSVSTKKVEPFPTRAGLNCCDNSGVDEDEVHHNGGNCQPHQKTAPKITQHHNQKCFWNPRNLYGISNMVDDIYKLSCSYKKISS